MKSISLEGQTSGKCTSEASRRAAYTHSHSAKSPLTFFGRVFLFSQHLDVPKERGRIRTTPETRIEGQTNAWAIGDCALIINALDGEPSPPTGQFAERQGRQAARNLVRVVRGEATQPFRFKALGQLCSIGGYQAVAEMFGMRISGFLAWFLWRGVYLFKLPTWSRRIKVAFDWAWDVILPRDLNFLNTEADPAPHARLVASR